MVRNDFLFNQKIIIKLNQLKFVSFNLYILTYTIFLNKYCICYLLFTLLVFII